ncbi:hypothetical protein FB472_0502 [Rhodoglobus vestalii]|uniref:DUF3137 domain-containing protein n=1 Tax=Rhodoglobus vestalii TaxID=193384 RepID=A0A8H2PW93_9MICO|nr:hypothetical protein [Rhodoglobus vestalii]TQO18970.1 hypothetical protein FB472_0502 [Rhodoglobus vestalii]
MLRSINYSALIDPVDPDAVARFRSNRRSLFGYSQRAIVTALKVGLGSIVAVFFAVIVGTQLFGVFAAIGEAALAERSLRPAIPSLLVLLPVMGAAIWAGYLGVRAWRRNGSPWQRFYRMNKFAEDNELAFAPLDTKVSYSGLLFDVSQKRSIRDRFRSVSGRSLEYGNYRYTTGSGKNRETHNWGLMALELDRALPHMVLDAKANNYLFGVSSLPLAFAKSQVLKLEGDFNSYFTLYCPQQYERDALYVFTPDLMALLIDHASPYDVEVVDSWLLVYSPQPFDLVDPVQHQRLLGIADLVGSKALRQSRNYADESIGDSRVNLIAPRGRRLRTQVPLFVFLVAYGFAALVGAVFLHDLLT